MQATLWDYIIVGAGSAGCVVANRLSACGTKRVLLIEAGGRDHSPLIKIPAAETRVAGLDGRASRYDWGYRCEPDPTRHNKVDHWARGRVVGGSSSINGMMYVRGSAVDYDRWAAMGNHGWSAKDVMPLFQSLERSDQNSDDKPDSGRGHKGPLYVRTVKVCHPTTQAFIEAAQQAGYVHNPDYNGASQEGVGYAQLTQRGGRRWSAADAFLKPALKRPNLQLIVNACVHKMITSKGSVRGVRYEQGGILKEAHAKDVILCSGAINTPKLLMLSGIGDADTLSVHGIDVVKNLPSVGKNLMEHPLINMTYRVNKPTYNPTEGIIQSIQFLMNYLFKNQGPIATGFEAAGFLKTLPTLKAPDIQLHFLPLGMNKNNQTQSQSLFLPYPSITVLINKNYPLSRGKIRLASSDPQAAPLIDSKLLSHDDDVATLARGIALVRSMITASALSGLVEEEIRPGGDNTDVTSLEDYIRRNTEPGYHPSGTCRMGLDDDAVVTPELQVKGVNNLWIADASIMPDLISGNTNAVCMMIGEKLSRQFTENQINKR